MTVFLFLLVHTNYLGYDAEKSPFFLSVVNNGSDNVHRCILWKKTVSHISHLYLQFYTSHNSHSSLSLPPPPLSLPLSLSPLSLPSSLHRVIKDCVFKIVKMVKTQQLKPF